MARKVYTNARLAKYIDGLPGAAERIAERAARRAEQVGKARAAVRTGEMRDKTTARKVGAARWRFAADADHSGFVEFGTVHMAAQPFFMPALSEAAAEMARAAREELKP